MIIDAKARKKLIEILKGTDYRKVVSERAECHPNTVSNTLLNPAAHPNEKVEIELLIFAKEVEERRNKSADRRQQAKAIAKQL